MHTMNYKKILLLIFVSLCLSVASTIFSYISFNMFGDVNEDLIKEKISSSRNSDKSYIPSIEEISRATDEYLASEEFRHEISCYGLILSWLPWLVVPFLWKKLLLKDLSFLVIFPILYYVAKVFTFYEVIIFSLSYVLAIKLRDTIKVSE